VNYTAGSPNSFSSSGSSAHTTMSESNVEDTPTRSHSAPPQLSVASFATSLSILLVIFVCLNPIWESKEMHEWNENIWWSYIPIPLLVFVFLKLEGKLVFSALLLETMKLTFVKFVITITVANVIWALSGTPGTGAEPEARQATDSARTEFELRAAPAATVQRAERLGALEGELRDASGEPVAGALIWIDSGLEEWTFDVPSAAHVLENGGTGFRPSPSVARVWQTVELRSTDAALHTVVIQDSDRHRLLNFPVLAEESRSLMFHEERGLLSVGCSVHGEAESTAVLLVTANPFFARTDAAGAFRFSGVPAAMVSVRALHQGHLSSASVVRVEARTDVRVELALD